MEKKEARPARPVQPQPDAKGNQRPRPNKPPMPPLNTKVTIPLRYLSIFWRSIDLSLINCE